MGRALKNDEMLRDLPGASAAGGGRVRVRAAWVSTPTGRKVVELSPMPADEETARTDAGEEIESDWWAVTVSVYDDREEHLCDLAMSEDNTVAALKTRLLAQFPEKSAATTMDFDETALKEKLEKIKMRSPPASQKTISHTNPMYDNDTEERVLTTSGRVGGKGTETGKFGIQNVLGIVRDIVAPIVSDESSPSASDDEIEEDFDDTGDVMTLVASLDETDEEEEDMKVPTGQLFGGPHSKIIVGYLPTNYQETFERILIFLQKVLDEYLPAVASFPPAAHLVFAITIAAVLVELLGFALWMTIAISVCYARVRSEEELRRRAENRNMKLAMKMQQVKSEFNRMKYIAEHVSSARDKRALNSLTKSGDLAWANAVMAATYSGFLRDWANRKIEKTISERLETQKPAILEKCAIVDFKLSDKAPVASAIRVIKSQKLQDGDVLLELAISADRSEFSFSIGAKLKLGPPIKIDVKFKAENLEARAAVVYTKMAPFAKTVRVSLAEVPKTSLSISHNGMDIADLPGVDIWIRTSIEKLTVNRFLEPNAIIYNCDVHWRKHQAKVRKEREGA